MTLFCVLCSMVKVQKPSHSIREAMYIVNGHSTCFEHSHYAGQGTIGEAFGKMVAEGVMHR